jgi:hypothetical protein
MPADLIVPTTDQGLRPAARSNQPASLGRQPTGLAAIYRWAHWAVGEMVHYRPALAIDLLRADPATRHFVALAIRGCEVHHGCGDVALRQLAAELFSRPRGQVLAKQWEFEFGRVSFLKRLPAYVLPRSQYDRIVAIAWNPAARALMGRCTKITHRELAALEPAILPLVAATSLVAVSTFGAPTIGYMRAAVRQHRPDLGEVQLQRLFARIGEVKRLGPWLTHLLEKSPLPPPPWRGTDAIIPLRTIAEICAAGNELKNCLGDPDRWLPVLLGRCFYYRVIGPRTSAIVGIVFDNLIGAWRIDSYAGPQNRRLQPAARQHIFAQFAAAGIGFFGDDPRHRVLNWYGIGDGFPLIPRW